MCMQICMYVPQQVCGSQRISCESRISSSTTYVFQGLNSGCHISQQVPLPIELSGQLPLLINTVCLLFCYFEGLHIPDTKEVRLGSLIVKVCFC